MSALEGGGLGRRPLFDRLFMRPRIPPLGCSSPVASAVDRRSRPNPPLGLVGEPLVSVRRTLKFSSPLFFGSYSLKKGFRSEPGGCMLADVMLPPSEGDRRDM